MEDKEIKNENRINIKKIVLESIIFCGVAYVMLRGLGTFMPPQPPIVYICTDYTEEGKNCNKADLMELTQSK